MHTSNCGCGCRSTSVAITPCTKDRCLGTLSNDKLDTLVWLQGLNEDFCERFQRVSDVLGLVDCAGNPISRTTPLVTCADFRARLCATFALLAEGGSVVYDSTQLVGADCKTYTIPSPGSVSETPNTAVDSSTVDVSATGTLGRAIGAAVKISAAADNIIIANGDGLYAPEPEPVLTTCQQLQNFPAGAPAVEGTILIGADCEQHTLEFPDTSITVTDTDSVNLTLTGNNLEAAVRLSPSSIGAIVPAGLEITCANVLTCAPPVTVLDSATVDHTLVGQQLSSAVRLSAVAGNVLSVQLDGLYLNLCQQLSALPGPSEAVVGVTELVGADCQTYTLPEAAVIGIADTTSVDLDIDGGPTLRATVNIQPNTLLTLGPQGLQVTCEAVQDCTFGILNNFWSYNDALNRVDFNPSADAGNQITVGSDNRPFVAPSALSVLDTSCINLTLASNVLSAAPIISAQPDNAIQCLGDGLFAQAFEVGITANNVSPCTVVTVAEPTPNNFEISAAPVISATAGNQLTCEADGLYVPESPAAAFTLIAGDTPCIQMAVVEFPADTWTVSAAPVISAQPCNAISCEADGLFATLKSTAFSQSSPAGHSLTIPSGLEPGDVFGQDCVTLNNPTPDCPMLFEINLNVDTLIEWNFSGEPITANYTIEASIFVETSVDAGATWRPKGNNHMIYTYAGDGVNRGTDRFATAQYFGTKDYVLVNTTQDFCVRYTAIINQNADMPPIDFSISTGHITVVGRTV